MLSRLSSVRERYESESYNIRIKYEREISEAEAELRSILSADYKAKYKKKYESSLSSLEGFYEEFVKSLLSLNGKKRKRKSGYTKYEVNYDWE